MMFVFGNKSFTLAYLKTRITAAVVLEQHTVTHGDWTANARSVTEEILALPWGRRPLIVRSSAMEEDGVNGSQAGRYESVPNVLGELQLHTAIKTVFASYDSPHSDAERVLIQPMLDDVVMSGVATSFELGTGRPYSVISYAEGGDTAAVTGGRTNALRVCYIWRGLRWTDVEGRLGRVARLLEELEHLTRCSALDIEFAFRRGVEEPVLLQARPLAQPRKASRRAPRLGEALQRASARVETVLAPHPHLVGRDGALGVMPDWNPAEIIGLRPRPLASSLYQVLVTDRRWAESRLDYAYRDVRGVPLMLDIAGLPFIDVRASFNSFVPAAVSDHTANVLVEHYLATLKDNPSLHDKIEFDIVLSCFTFDLDERLERLPRDSLRVGQRHALRQALLNLTERVIMGPDSPWTADLRKLAELDSRRRQTATQPGLDPLVHAAILLSDCGEFGSRPFAGLARAGFMARQLLQSLTAVGAITPDDERAFMMGLHTVSTEIAEDSETLDFVAFFEKYGHLRPGSYDIRVPRYDEAPDAYFPSWRRLGQNRAGRGLRPAPPKPSPPPLDPIAAVLRKNGVSIPAERLMDFIASAIRERERAKFRFTRVLSDALQILTQWGERVGFTPDDLSYAKVSAVIEAAYSSQDPAKLIGASIKAGRKRYRETLQTALPPLITSPQDIWRFHLPAVTPNYVTRGVAAGPVARDVEHDPLAGAIVMLPTADPGFDWIFTRGVAGLITAFGGANSHMAIRASELDLPAVIGAGERLFDKWAAAPALRIDCVNHSVEILPHAPRQTLDRRHTAG